MNKSTLIKQRFPKLEWFALIIEPNTKEVVPYNIMREDLCTDLLKMIKEKEGKYGYNDIKDVIKRWAMYHYWSKFEYEFDVYTLFEERVKKTSVWEQVEPNLDRLTEYIIGELML